MIKVVVTGALGKMGSAVVRIIKEESDVQLIAGVEAPGHPSIGEEIDRGLAPDGVPILDTLEEVIDETDCLVDFTNPKATLGYLKVASSGKTPSVVGTTGFSEEEIDRIEELQPDAIVLDVMLPDIDGWQVLTHLYDRPATRSIPVIVCSVVREEALALALGATSFLSKPIRPHEFVAALDQALLQASGADARAAASSAGAC